MKYLLRTGEKVLVFRAFFSGVFCILFIPIRETNFVRVQLEHIVFKNYISFDSCMCHVFWVNAFNVPAE